MAKKWETYYKNVSYSCSLCGNDKYKSDLPCDCWDTCECCRLYYDETKLVGCEDGLYRCKNCKEKCGECGDYRHKDCMIRCVDSKWRCEDDCYDLWLEANAVPEDKEPEVVNTFPIIKD